MYTHEIIGDNLRRLRQEQDLTQEQLAFLSGIGVKNISELELYKRENPGLRTLERLARALGIAVWELLRPFEGAEKKEENKNERDNQ